MSDPKNAAHRVSLKLLCVSENKILMLHLIDKRWTLVGGGVDIGDDIMMAMKREFKEETGNVLPDTILPELVHAEIKQFPNPGKFSAALNLFYVLRFDHPFEVTCEPGVYEGYQRCTLEELLSKEVSDHFNKEVVVKAMKS